MTDIFENKIKFLVGCVDVIKNAVETPALPMFSDKVVGFLSELSKELLSIPGIRDHLDVMSYAYWIRKASLEKTKGEFVRADVTRMGRGVAFHIAPSNVPVNFAVSMTSALLAGNICIIRVSNKEFEEVNIICSAIKRILNKTEYEKMKSYICIVRYEHNDEITAYLSSICDVRIIWGGNRTIEQIRRSPIPPRAIEMCFADRHSVAIINADEYLKLAKDPDNGSKFAQDIAKKFYTDTYYTDQNACSSPRIVVWLKGNNSIDEAKQIFWEALEKEVSERYELQPIQAVDKLSMATELSMKKDGVRFTRKGNKLFIVDVNQLSGDVMDFKMSGGYFFQYSADSLLEITPILGKMCQTVAVLGIDKRSIVNFVLEHGVRGVDRVVDLGDTMGLEFTWDGFRMIEAMSRVIYIYEK
ncbi:Acyl-CoA reductase (LuxC) [Fibrobacter sp. UWH9]|uniref:acyl-CoA reductase n=1 Tax=Fibrobacter sp. UWH9 TaxID=1896213 RepID=UPI00091D4450|nr:acyl-CoA reductase [Fibrobacter sp. UWH9]SHG32705.1 Acyl-CoA reductase (LuxC) [Fibrobacter sp. UWH9]